MDSAAPPVRRPTGGLERFTPEPEPPLALEQPDTGQPFVRCVRCGADSSRHATACGNCDARLDTDEGRAFNTRLWAQATAAREQEAEEHRRREEGEASAGASGEAEPAMAAELTARLQAQLELERLEQGRTPAWLQLGSLGAGPLRLLALALGIPGLLLVLVHRGPSGASVLLLGLGGLLLVAARRAP